MPEQLTLSVDEAATVLAALRYWQRTFAPHGKLQTPIPLDLLEHFDHVDILTKDEIDTLCEKINA